MTINIIVSLQVEGIHCWPECPIEEVSFLRDPHRHTFFIECKKEVNHTDRDVEIIQLKHKMVDFLGDNYFCHRAKTHLFNRMSCEDIALILVRNFDLNSCSVLEDNENGAEVIV